MIEMPPEKEYNNPQIMQVMQTKEFSDFITKHEKTYPYWDKAKYLIPRVKNKELFWAAIRFKRFSVSTQISFGKYNFTFPHTGYFLEFLHQFDMNFSGTLTSQELISEKNKQYYQLSSIMEEAIASSQMEGANTTRKVAKEMLRCQKKPKDKSQQMITNNYNTIQFLAEHKDELLSKELLLKIHKLISEKTLDNPDFEGAFRTSNDIVVQDALTGDIAHIPPAASELPKLISQLIKFINNDSPQVFIHPIIKAIIIHFMISFFHPFTDGNGRTARSLVYWYMLKKGYYLTEFLSISRIIYKSKKQYENAFLYTENDKLDLGYFIQYNLNVMKKSYDELKIYLERKMSEQSDITTFSTIANINQRQAHILKIASDKPKTIFISKELQTIFSVSIKTIRNDLQELVKLGFLNEVALNKRLVGYIKSEKFEHILQKNKKKKFMGN